MRSTIHAVTGGDRHAVIDIGSNSVRLVVFDGGERAPEYFFNEKIACGLGAGIADTGRLDPKGRDEALRVISRFAAILERIGAPWVEAVATAAVREAADGADFCADVEAATGIRPRVISGADEARLAALGVHLAEPTRRGLVLDMGGASVELCPLGEGGPGRGVTLPLGPQWLVGLDEKARRKRVREVLNSARPDLEIGEAPLTLVGGAWRAFAKIAMHLEDHPLKVLHGFAMPRERALANATWIGDASVGDIRAIPGVSAGRAANAGIAAGVLTGVIETFEPTAVIISAFGLREGVYHEMLPPGAGTGDPLLEACARMETRQARYPGFGDELWSFIEPVIAAWSAADRRLARAACHLNDVNWRAHPDYRALSCFETVTRSNLTGLDHRDRVFLGGALMNRYGGARPGADVAAALAMLGDGDTGRAKALGRAMRLGAMLASSAPGSLRAAALVLENDRLALRLPASDAALRGPAVDKRLAALASALDLSEGEVSIADEA
jgi:exopolyphosphatase/guanosine-5'-triphosphate,3'-diphosphate pyrophosphatase